MVYLSIKPMDSVDSKRFNILFAITQAVGILSVILVTVWTSKYRNGFTWRSNPMLEFNWHPLLMTVGFVYLFANSILIYRGLRNMRKQKLKLIHAGIHTAVCFCVIIALVAVFDSHNLAKNPIPNLYSLHSWVGLTAVILYFGQWAISLASFLYPGASLNLRAMMLPWHVFLGITIFILSIAACLMGLTEKAFFSIKPSYDALPGEGVLVNIIGVLFIFFAILVIFLVTEVKYKRLPRPEDGALLQTSSPE